MSVELRDIHKTFGPVHANDGINLTFQDGRIYGILGENGAGKSTLMKTLSGFYKADAGQILVDDKPTRYDTPLGAIRAGIGMLQQDPLDVGPFSVLENFVYGQPAGPLPDWRSARERFQKLNERFGFGLNPNAYVEQLTIGQRQQLEIIRLIALGVRLLILDEPTTGISAEQKDVLFNSLKRLAHDDGLTVLFVSHKLEDVLDLCDEVAVLRRGKLVGTAQLPSTTGQLVSLMFGQELAPATRADAPIGAPVIEGRNLTLEGQRVKVQGLNLRINAGEVMGLAGLDGSGQELLLRACVGLLKPSGGELIVQGTRCDGETYRAFLGRGIGFGAAGRLEEGLVSGLTLTEHFALVDPDQRGWIDWNRARTVTEANIRRYNIVGRPENRIEMLSGGNQQRTLIALMPAQPCLLVLEHPTRGLDVESARWIWEQILARRAEGTAILFTSADLDEIATYSDRILVFYAGQVSEVPDARNTTVDELGHLIGGGHLGKESAA